MSPYPVWRRKSMNFPSLRLSFLLAVSLAIALPVSLSHAQQSSALSDPNLEKTPLPDYQYSPDGDSPDDFLPFTHEQGFSGTRQVNNAEKVARRRKIEEMLRKNPDMPEYLKKAYRASLYTGDTNVRRFAQAASEFQKQELREQLIEHIDDPEKLNRLMTALYGKSHSPYKPVGSSGYVLNQETGEITRGNDDLSAGHDRKMQAGASRKKNSSRKREKRGNNVREDRYGGTSSNMKEEYLAARARAVAANRPDLVEELDRMARKNGLFD